MPDQDRRTAGPARLLVSDSDEVVPYHQLTGSPPTRAVKRLVRRSLRWYLWPLARQISAHNDAVSRVLAGHRHQLTWLRQESERVDRDADLL